MQTDVKSAIQIKVNQLIRTDKGKILRKLQTCSNLHHNPCNKLVNRGIKPAEVESKLQKELFHGGMTEINL